MSNIIEAEGLTKRYRAGDVIAVDNVSFSVVEGSITAVTGKSGCGKTTLLNLIGGLDSPTAGKILICGTDISSMSESKLSDFRAQNIGFVFQFFNLIPELTAEENIYFTLAIRKNKIDFEYGKSIAEVLEITELMKRLPSQLSGGQQQRVAIARAVMHTPKILLMDEPTGNLDEENAVKINTLIKRLRDELGITILYVTHDNDMAASADRIIRLSDGHIVSDEVSS